MTQALRLEDRGVVQGIAMAIHCAYVQHNGKPPDPVDVVSEAMLLLRHVDYRLAPPEKSKVASGRDAPRHSRTPERRRRASIELPPLNDE